MFRFLRATTLTAAFGVLICIIVWQAHGQMSSSTAAPQGGAKFPLAAPAGKDSGQMTTPPAGAVNQGPLDPAHWQYGHAFDAPRCPRSGIR